MSDGRRSPDAPPVAEHNAGDGDFYATVSASAGANRSTRIRTPGDGPTAEPATHAEPVEAPGTHAEPVEARGTHDEPSTHAEPVEAPSTHAEPVEAPRTHAEPVEARAEAGKGWRDRWNSLAASVTGKPANGSKPAPAATHAEPVAAAYPGTTASAAPVVEPVDVPRVTRTEPVEAPRPAATSTHAEPVETPAPLVDPPTATIPAVAAAAAGTAVVATTAGTAVTTTKTTTAAKPKPGVARRTRKARLRLSRIDPWSVMKTSFLFSIAAGIVLVVAVYVVWTVIGSSGLFSSINEIVGSVVSTPGDTTPFRIEEYVNTQKVMGVTAFVAAIDVVIFTALATLGSFLYNLAATMLGGLEVTLAED